MLITYMTFEDGRKIVASTWPRRNFEGLADMETGDKVWILFMETCRGVLRVRSVELIRTHDM